MHQHNPALLLLCTVTSMLGGCAVSEDSITRDVGYFLRNLRTVDHLPALEHSKTMLSSTWHRSGDIGDPHDFKRIEGDLNILLDAEGSGCVHRIFTGVVKDDVLAGTRIQVFLDRSKTPLFDMPAVEFFDDKDGPLPYPLVFHKTYPGTLFPIPFAKHCLIQLVNKQQKKNWGNFWQITYTRYAPGTQVQSLSWPLDPSQQQEVQKTCQAWLQAESSPPASPDKWDVDKSFSVNAGCTERFELLGVHNIGEMRVRVEPATPEILRHLRLRINWDRQPHPSVDVPIGYLFGHGDSGHVEDARFSSLLLSVTDREAISRFPMPFEEGARFEFENGSTIKVDTLDIKLKYASAKQQIPANFGRFHATWHEEPSATSDAPRYGTLSLPAHHVLERKARGKYVGAMLRIPWPYEPWWGEGDWLIWTDETGWPPSYHGTGSEEYFNSGWGRFDRKAVSGYVRTRPGDVAVYSFHLNDAFQFQDFIRVAVETVGYKEGQDIIEEKHPRWGTTAYWYALPAQPAGSHGR